LYVRKVLSAFNDYLEKDGICLSHLSIEHIDIFLAEYNGFYARSTRATHRWCLRGFLRYLYHVVGVVQRDFAPLLVSAPVYAQSRPPKFLRPHEVQRLFDSLKLSSPVDLRTYAMVHLIFTLGLRPKEISVITLDDISFTKGEVSIKDRKAANPIILPLPDTTIKAIAAYIVGARPKCEQRALLLSHRAPHNPINASTVCKEISRCMRKANLPGSAYWLRHTYAQNLLEQGATIFEINQMLGHERFESSQHYIRIHTQLMREVLFNETF
jgi:site-specific recombinase XerD